MANVETFIVLCIKHLAYLLASFNIDNSSSVGTVGLISKARKSLRSIKRIVLGGIRLAMHGLLGLGQAERKLVQICSLLFQVSTLVCSVTLPVGSFHP